MSRRKTALILIPIACFISIYLSLVISAENADPIVILEYAVIHLTPYLIAYYLVIYLKSHNKLAKSAKWLIFSTFYNIIVYLKVIGDGHLSIYEYLPLEQIYCYDLGSKVSAAIALILAPTLIIMLPVNFFIFYYWVKNRINLNKNNSMMI